MKSNFKSILVLVSLVLLVVLAVSLFSGRLESKDSFTYGKLNELLENNLVTSLHIDTNLNAKVEAYKPKTDDKGNFVKDEEGNIVSRPRTGIIRLMVGMVSLAFAIYMVPGLWGAHARRSVPLLLQ